MYENERTKGVKIALAITIIIAVLAITALAIPLGIYVSRNKANSRALNATYERAYYETLDSMNNIELRLSKVRVLSGTSLKQEYLRDIWRESGVAASNMSQIGTESEEITNIIRFLNQLGDYCYYLNMKLKGGELSEKEQDNLATMHTIVKDINASLAEAHGRLIGKSKIDITVLSNTQLLSETIMAHATIDYPELIYDGPFSDGLNDREAKYLAGKEDLSVEQAKERLIHYFAEATDVRHVGESLASIQSYMFDMTLNGSQGTAQITKKGGYLVSYNAFHSVNNPQYTEEQCVEHAQEFLEQAGFNDMKAVWTCNNDSTMYINFAYFVNGVICYPDLIKVKINCETGDVTGVDAQSYIYNHTEEREGLAAPEGVEISVNGGLTVESENYCLIPTEWNAEIMAKEVVATAGGITFYLYFDVETKEEIKVFVVIDDHGRKMI